MRRAAAPSVLTALLVALGGGTLAGCAHDESETPAPSTTATVTATSTSTAAEPVEPTTTNTLPPPPRPSRPAPSTAGPLSAASLPVPAGWRTVEPPGNDEIGQQGNGTWVQALDPRYAAQGAMSTGCADVTRDDYPDPVAALEGGYTSRTDDPGVGLALEFSSAGDASAFWATYVRQLRACEGATDGVFATGVEEPAVADGAGLIDRRTDQTQDPTAWTEVAALHGARVVLLSLGDPGHRISPAATSALLAQIPA